jgi:hypothetical protein
MCGPTCTLVTGYDLGSRVKSLFLSMYWLSEMKSFRRVLLRGQLGLSETLPNFTIESKQNALQCFGGSLKKATDV